MPLQRIRPDMIEGLAETIEDTIGAKVIGGTGISVVYNDANGQTTITNTGDGSGGGGGPVNATSVGFTPVGSIEATNVQLALQELDTEKAAASHTHSIANVTGLQGALDGKASTSHTHIIADTTGLQAALDAKAAATHSHAIADVTGLQTALDGKAGTAAFSSGAAGLAPASGGGTTNFLRADGSWAAPPGGGGGVSDGDKGDIVVSASGATWTIDAGVVGTSKLGGDITTAGKALLDDADAAAQRTTLGLGTAATSNTGDFAASSHTHPATAISDSTSVGRSILTAADAAAVRTAAVAYGSAGGALSGPVSHTIAGGAAKGTVSSGTATFNLNDGNKQTITNGGAHTWAFSNWPASGTYGEIEIFCTNAGAFTITLPTINWVKGDGTVTTTFSGIGVTLQSSGLNHFIFWTVNGGTTIYGVAR